MNRWLVASLALGLAGCSVDFHDTEGAAYVADCSEKRCKVQPIDPESEQAPRLLAEGKILLVCPPGSAPEACRPVRCKNGEDPCSKLGGPEFACNGALCEAGQRKPTPQDRLSTCLATTGPYQSTPEQLLRAAHARACVPPCEFPAMCLPAVDE
jgi:hypothetical protein